MDEPDTEASAGARAMVAARNRKLTPQRRSEIARKAAKARQARLTPEERSAAAAHAVGARWALRKTVSEGVQPADAAQPMPAPEDLTLGREAAPESDPGGEVAASGPSFAVAQRQHFAASAADVVRVLLSRVAPGPARSVMAGRLEGIVRELAEQPEEWWAEPRPSARQLIKERLDEEAKARPRL